MNVNALNFEPGRIAQRALSAVSVVAPPAGVVKAAIAGADALVTEANYRTGRISEQERNMRLRWDAKDALLGVLQTLPGANIVLGISDLVSDTFTAPQFSGGMPNINPGPLSENMRVNAALAQHQDVLLAMPGVTGVGVGQIGDRLGIVVMLATDKVPDALKPILQGGLNGIPVTTQVTGEFSAPVAP